MASENMNKDDTDAKAKSVRSIVIAVVLGLAFIIVLCFVLYFLYIALLFGYSRSLMESISQGGSDTLNALGKMVIPYLTQLF